MCTKFCVPVCIVMCISILASLGLLGIFDISLSQNTSQWRS